LLSDLVNWLSGWFKRPLSLSSRGRLGAVKRTLLRLRLSFEDGERPSRITARNLDDHFIPEHMDRPTISALDYKGAWTCIAGNRT